jgi:hypothetical protein
MSKVNMKRVHLVSDRFRGVVALGAVVACLSDGASCARSETAAPNSTGAPGVTDAPRYAGEYEVGGPLAGVKLQPFDRGVTPEVMLYPGSVEHYRTQYMKYVPTRSFFDAQSQLKNWVVPNLPGAENKPVEQFAPPIYKMDRNTTQGPTGKFQDPVSVIRIKALDPVFKLDLGDLKPGMYAVRVIAAAETAKLRAWEDPIYFSLKVNDGVRGETNTYRVRSSYTDDFYSVVELYFNAPEARHYTADLTLDQGSKAELLVHNISLDDVLAGSVRRPIKQKVTLTTPEEVQAIKEQFRGTNADTLISSLKPLSSAERLARDEALWKWLPPINVQGSWLNNNPVFTIVEGSADKTSKEIEDEFGKWELDDNRLLRGLPYEPKLYNAFLVNKKLGLSYTLDDLWAHKPLPTPYPYQDDGAGLYFPDPKDPTKGRQLTPIADQVSWRYRDGGTFDTDAVSWIASGNPDVGRDAAIGLIRFAYQYPSIEASNFLSILPYVPTQGRDLRFRHREQYAYWMSGYPNYTNLIQAYDRIFPYIQGNEELAQSVHRFIPAVKTSKDVIELLDTYLVQTVAKRILRYHYVTIPTEIAHTSTVLADPSVTDPWMDWLFTRMFQYPLRLAGAQDIAIVSNDREGPQLIGSSFYSVGESAAAFAAGLTPYVRATGSTKFDLSDPVLYPKTLAHCYWQLNTTIGGMDFARIGDVTGPEKAPGFLLKDGENFRLGWQWSKDPQFAWMLKNIYGRRSETDAEWAKILTAAATVKRAPYLDLHSRQIYNWFGALETGLQHDDYRFRRAVYVRTGTGYGHDHADSLDLQFVAHGVPMTIDAGQRSGYTKPNDKFTRLHNTVEVEGGNNEEYGYNGQSWISSLSDAAGARYMQATAMPPANTKLFRRQVALIDVDEGQGSQPVPMELQKPGSKLPPVAKTSNSYIFDVFRVSGGKVHNYCFHGPVEDEFSINSQNVKPVENVGPTAKPQTEADYLSIFELAPEKKMGGDAPETLEATWRYSRNGGMGSEQQMLGQSYNEAAGRKYTRLHLLGAGGMRALTASAVSTHFTPGYNFTCLLAQKRGENLESAFPAIIEPYEGEPFITSQKLLPVQNNDADASRAVAVAVETKNGHHDVCLADGQPDKMRTIDSMRFSGEFGYYSTDANGLRQATLTGGTLLSGPEVRLASAQRERTGKVTSVDYLKKTFQIDGTFPSENTGRIFEIGSPDRTTSYTTASVMPDANGSTFQVTRGADFYRGQVDEIMPDNTVYANLEFTLVKPGLDKGWIASNDQRTKFWRVKSVNGSLFALDGPVAKADFAPSNAIRLWEYGAGDTVRQSTSASLRRLENDVYELSGDVDVTVALKASKIEFSTDRANWRALNGKPANGLYEVGVALGKLPPAPVYLKVSP